jgi:acetyl-CoA C-acetyltransferase
VQGALTRSGLSSDLVEEVIMGCIGQAGPDAYNARRVALAAGLPNRIPAYTVNRLCGSGLQAIWSAAQQLHWGGADIIVAGGDENMSRLPFLDYGARNGYRLGDRTLLDGTLAMLTDPFQNVHMGRTAEAVAQKYDISRDAQDQFAAESQRRAGTDEAKAAFAQEIVPVDTAGRGGRTIELDEHPRPETTFAALNALRPAFETGGTVTAGNAAGINDGAAAVVVMRESTRAKLGIPALATLEVVATAAMEPELMGYAPVLALAALSDRIGLQVHEIDIIELNEAFAAQAVAVIRDAKLDPDKTNPYGGAIALGHPVGATGAILALRAAKDLARRNLETAVVTMCIGGGRALAALLRRHHG